MKKAYLKVLVSFIVITLLVSVLSVNVMAGGKYEGITLNVLCTTGWLAKVWHTDAQVWAKEQGAKVKVIETALDPLYDKMMAEFIVETGAYDIVQYPPFWNGDVMGGGFLRPLDDFIAEKDPNWDDYMPVFRDRLSKWAGETYALQIDGDIFVLAYRKDLFEDSKEKAAFKEKYGYDLHVPKTWEEYLDVAEFFTRDTNGDGKLDFWGTADIAKATGSSVWHFFARLASYLDSPYVYKGGIYFDPDTMEPLVNTPAGIKALENHIATTDPKRSPPGALAYDWAEVWDAFVSGRVAMVFAWPDLGPLSIDPEKSKIIGKVGFSVLPGATSVWNVETDKWEQAIGIHAASPLAWGWCIATPKSSKHAEAAYDLMRYIVTGERAIHQAIWGDDGMDPYRISQFESKEVKEAYKEIPDFLPALRANIAIGIPDLRIPGTKEYYDVLPIYISKALEGKMTPKEALDAAAVEWKSITQERGFNKQKMLYRESLGLTP